MGGSLTVVDLCAVCLVRGCALIDSLAIWAYSFTGLPFVINIISVNGSESLGPVVQKCHSTSRPVQSVCVCVMCNVKWASKPRTNRMMGDYVHEGEFLSLNC